MINPFVSVTITVRDHVVLDTGAWAPISQWCPLKETVHSTSIRSLAPIFTTMTQSADFQLAESAWKHWKRSGT